LDSKIQLTAGFRAGMAMAGFVFAVCLPLQCESGVQLVADRPSYNVNSDVFIRLAALQGEAAHFAKTTEVVAVIRYVGEDRPVASKSLPVSDLIRADGSVSDNYLKIWRVPLQARAGRYEIDLQEKGAEKHETALETAKVSFTVYKKLLRIDEINLGKTFYVSGDPVSAEVMIENLTDRPLNGLRIEFSNRYWPWIAGPAEAARASVVTLAQSLDLPAHAIRQLRAEKVEIAQQVDHPTTHQYGVVVWDQKRKTVLDISFSQLIFIHPPGVNVPVPYPAQYVYPNLQSVRTSSYRHFYPPDPGSAAVQFQHDHTMFAAGSDGEVRFSIRNPTLAAWRGVTIDARLVSPPGTDVAHQVIREATDLKPGDSPQEGVATFRFPSDPGVYRAVVEVKGSSGDILASDTLELGVNPLPRSIVIFCAHEDDEGGYSGLTRAAIENRVPVRFVYFTSGDAGSCDRYYQHSCSPAEAANFGAIRMEEVRASLGHLGVPRDAISFVGLPDGGSGMIWYNHHEPSDPFLDPLLATDHAPYDDLVHPNLPYARDAVLKIVEELVSNFHPEVICAAHPGSVGHIDHIVNGYFVIKALQELKRQGALSSALRVLVDPAQRAGQPKTPYRYRPVQFYVSGGAAALAQEAAWFYQSQTGNRAEGNMRTFDQLPHEESFREVLDWSEYEGWNEKRPESQ
jgi:LmbE family N-acetylglucosaminyl deacetylase